MLAALSQLGFTQPNLDYHAFAPEFVLVGTLVLVLLADLVWERDKSMIGTLAGLGILAAIIPTLTLAVDGADRTMFGGAYVVDNFALFMKVFFLIGAYVVVLLSTNYVAEGDYYEGEYYILLLASLLGMTVMASSRDLVSIFIALELVSIPAYMLAAWRKRDAKSNEAGMKYYLMGVFATAVLLYGMSLVYGVTGSTLLTEINAVLTASGTVPVVTLGVVFCIAGFAFKVSAVPFHAWAPDVYEGAPTPVTAYLSVSSKAAGFVAILQLVLVGFFGQSDVWQPMFWGLAALSMTVGNLAALQQTNAVRMLAYSGIAQAGYIMAPLAVAVVSGDPGQALSAMLIYLALYAAMNFGAFGIIMAVARKTRSAEVSSFGGLFQYAPGLTVVMTCFLFALAGIPPLGGWYGKFAIFKALANGGGWGYGLAVVVAVNSVIAFFYYARILKEMWFNPVPDEDRTPIKVPPALVGALGICVAVTLVLGVYPQAIARFGDVAHLAFLQ